MQTTWKRPAGRAWVRVRAWMALALVAGLAACGGGGGSSASVQLSQSEIRLADSYDDAQSPAPQSVSVTVDGDDVAAVGVGYDSGYPAADWVGAQLSGTRSPYTLLVGVGSAAPVGEHTAHLVVGALDAQGRALDIKPLTVHYKVLARLRADTPSLAFAGINGATPPAPQTLSLRAEGLSWTAQADQPWILLSQASGTGASDLTVSVDDAGLASGAHTGHIAFTASDGQTLTVPVSFELTSTALTVTPSSLTFGGATGRDMAAQAVELSLGTDGNAYAWRVQSLPAWLAADIQEGTVSQTPQTIRLTPDPAQLAAGTHTARLVLSAEVNGDTVTQEVALTIHVDGRRLYLSRDGVAFTSSPGWSRLSRTLTVKDNFGTATAWTASSDQGWLTVTGSGIGGGQLALNANPATLAEGLHMATVTVRSADARFAPSVVHVGLWKSSTTPAATVTRTGVSYRQLVADTVRPFVYVHSGGTSIDVFNPYTNTRVATMTNVGNSLGAMSVAPDGQRLYVVDNGFSRVAVVDLNTRRRTHFMATTPNNGHGLLATRVKGTDLVLVGNRSVYRASDGARVDDGSGPMGIMVAGPGGERVYTQNTGTSPSGGGVYAVDYTGAFGGRFVSTYEGGGETGSNGQDIAVAPDGATVYTASGAPYRIQTFRGSDFSPIGELPEFDAYPNNVDVGTDGRVAGGINGLYSTHDIWVYSRTGAVQKRYKVVGYASGLRTGTLNFTPDALMLATLSDDDRMVFIPVGP